MTFFVHRASGILCAGCGFTLMKRRCDFANAAYMFVKVLQGFRGRVPVRKCTYLSHLFRACGGAWAARLTSFLRGEGPGWAELRAWGSAFYMRKGRPIWDAQSRNFFGADQPAMEAAWMLSTAAFSVASNSASLCLAFRPSDRAREKDAIMPVFFDRMSLASSRP